MSLSKRLQRLEVIVSAAADEGGRHAYQTDEWRERWCEVANGILATAPLERRQQVVAEAQLDADRWGPITRRVVHLADLGASGWLRKPLDRHALPEALCRLLEDGADFHYVHDCEDCGLDVPTRSRVEMDRLRAERGAQFVSVDDRAVLSTCPRCGGAVKWCGHLLKRDLETWHRQLAEIGGKKAGPTGEGRTTEGSTS